MSATVDRVIADLAAREQTGIVKYGTTVDRSDFSHRQWLHHAYEEALDMALYLRRAIDVLHEDGT